ncbi:MAG: S9 family peptidase [Gemmatimonadetes bacterium]|nr:S9 family peptidase [Gemmatimonadota bacterium]
MRLLESVPPALALLTFTAAAVVGQQQKQPLASVEEALVTQGLLAGRPGPVSVNWIDEGARFSYTVTNPQTRQEEIRRYDPATLQDEPLFQARDLTLPGIQEPLAYESFQWARDSRNLVFQVDFRPIYRNSGVADFYVYALGDKTIRLAADDARTAELSPDGKLLGYELGGDLFAYDMDAARERRLTTGGSDSLFTGVFDWVYEEEFGQAQAWRWSPDSRRIAFWQTDERGVPSVELTDYSGKHPEFVSVAYPKVGDHNPEVRIGVVDVATGQTRMLDLGETGEFLVPRIYWTAAKDTLAVMTMNRVQNRMRVQLFDVNTGTHRLLFEETSPKGWIDVFDFFAGTQDYLYFPEGTRDALWISDRDGHQHVYRYDYTGKLINQVTQGTWTVTRVEGIDPKTRTIYYTSTETSPLERHLYAIGFDGKGKRKLTQAKGTHSIDLSPSGRFYLDTWSSTTQPKQVELWSTEGKKLTTLESNEATTRWLATHVYSAPELFRFTTSDGVALDGSMIKPPDFDPARRYPVLLSIYGGPGSQEVYDQFESDGWYQYLAQQGTVVVQLNNRGSGNYGRDFMEVVYLHLGEWESKDFAETARYLGTLPWVDKERIGIQGTSYGGYMSIYTLLRYPELFALGIANSPVTDWRLYDTIYTERYMGLLEANDTGYEGSAAMPMVDRLQGHLLLIHSAMDENVHPQNTMQLLTALAAAGKDVDLRFYPPGAHGAAFDRNSYVTMTEVYTNTICEHLARQCTPQNLNR